MDDERRKKIEAGKLKLAEFKKKRHKNAKTKNVESPSSPRSTDSASIKSADEKLESLNSSSTDSLTMKESKFPSKESMDSNLEVENSAALSEGSDDTAHLVNADTKLLSLYDQKIKKFQTAIQHKDAIIQKLTSSLESTMNANEAADSAGNKEVVYLKQEINYLQLQMKEAAEMLERQKSKLDIQHACDNESRAICETGVQVELTEFPLFLSSLSEEKPSLEEVLAKFPKTPDLHEKLSNYLISNATADELQHFVKDLNHSVLTDHAAGDREAVQPVQDNLQQIHPSDFSSLSRKLETLNVVAKLIESLVNASSRYSNESTGDFSCSKFQSFFLRRLNSTEAAEQYASESESVVSDINYAEVQPECEKSFVKNSSEFSAIEKLRSRVLADDFSLVTKFLLEEMDKISVTVPQLSLGPQGDVTDVALPGAAQKILSETTGDESDYHKFVQQKSKLESRLQHLKKLDQELQDAEQNNIQRSIDSDTLTNSEDNILLEEPPLSCVSLLSLTDSEYKIEYATTDSEANFSRKVSFDMSRPAQERGFCTRCDKCFDLMQERYDDHVCIFKEALENNLNFEKIEAVKKLECEIEKLRLEKEKQVELLCEEQELKLEHVSREYSEQLSQLQVSQSKWSIERDNFLLKIESLEEEITQSSKKIHDLIEEKAEVVDLVQELQQDLEDLKIKSSNQLVVEKERLETEFLLSLERLKKTQEEVVSHLKCAHIKELEERETCLNAEHSKVINLLETTHSNESATYQKKIEQLLEEKCELLAKTTQEYEAILKKNHKALVLLCNHLRTKLSVQKEKVLNESRRSGHSEMEVSFSDALDELNRSIEQGIIRFLNQNYFLSDEENFDETEYLSFDIRQPVSVSDFPPKKNAENMEESKEEESEKEAFGSRSLTQLSERAQSEGSLELDDMLLMRSEINKLQEEFQKDAAVYEHVNTELRTECQALRQQAQELENHKEKLEMQLNEKEKELTLKESQLAAIDADSVKHGVSGTQLSSSDLRSWQVDAAQTNSRLLHVLSDLVKTFLDIEHDINTHLIEHGLIPSRSGTLTHHDDETGHSVGSREDFTSLSIGECPTIELAEDGPDLTPRAWDLYTAVGTYDTEIEGEDVVLGASRRLRLAVDHVLNLLTRAMNNQQNQDLKLLLKRNEELSVELQEESLGRDAVQMELVTAESNVRKLEAEKQRLEDFIRDLKESQEDMKRELCIERNKVSHLTQDKETASDEMQTLKNHCDMLASRLGDPERMGVHKMLNSSDTHTNEQPELLQENSRLSNEKHSVQKNLSKERQSFLDRVHQMETALEELKAEKEEIIEMKCKEIRDLKAEMEAMEKQLQSNKKFIDEQAQEREQEREEYIKEMNKMQDVVRDKEKIQSNEAQMTREIESLEHMLQARIEDHQNAMKKKESVENDLRQSLDKNRDLREIIEELEKQLDSNCKIVVDLQKKLASLNESINIHEKINSVVDEGVKSVQSNGESMEHVENLKEQLASQSEEIEQMSLNQTLLHELRGQIHFLEAKVEQRARQLEAMHLSSFTSPIQSDDNSPCGSQSSEILQMPCEDGYEISPRSVHWLEIQRLEEKIGRLAHIDEELIKKNKDVELQLKKMRITQTECQHENAALQEKLSEQLLQISVLKSHIEEQKHRCTTPQKSQATNDRVEELHEAYEKQLENNNRLFATLQEMQGTLCASQDEMKKKDELISVLQKAAVESKNQTHATKNEMEPSDRNESACFKLMLLEKTEEIKNKALEIESLQKELEEIQKNASSSLDIARELEIQTKLAEELKEENTRLKSEIEILRNEVESLNEELSIAREDVEKEQARFETLCEEMANLSHNRPEDTQSDKLGKNETNAKAVGDAKAILTNKLVLYENQLREKNLELSVLNATVTKLECSLRASKKDLELEQVQVDTLLQELGSLTGYQKRLEHDFNVVQEMNQKKERELAILQEETDDQIKLEAEIESLEKELEEQQSIELELKQRIKALEAALDASQTAFKHENEQWRSRLESLERAHSRETCNLKKQIEILHRNISFDVEDIDLSDVKMEIMEAAKAFNADGSKAYEDLIYALLKKAVDIKLKQSLEKHESQTKEINESWQQRIKSEMETRCEKLEKENLLLRERFSEQNNRLSSEKDAQWQTRVNEIENSLRKKLKEKYSKELNALKGDLDSAMKEKDSALAKIDELNQQLWKVKQSSQDEQSEMLRRLEAKAKSKLKNNEHSEMVLRQEIEKLQEELNSKLEKEKRMETQHREEVSNLHRFFETHWSNEMKKIQASQIEELKKLKDSKEKNIEALCNHLFSQYGEKLKKLQDEYAAQLSEERKHADTEHELELRELRQALERRFEKEKQQVLEMKEREVKEATESLERRYNRKISELRKSVSSGNDGHSGENDKSRLEAEKLELLSVHERELKELRVELESKYKKQIQDQLKAHDAQMRSLEETCSRRVDEAHELIKEAKRAASRSCQFDSGSNRTATPSSEMTSSDEACSSCQEDMLPGNKHILVNKIYQDGKRILSLMGNSTVPSSSEKEARLWIEERQWIVNKIKNIVPDIVVNPGSLKLVISNLVDEIRNSRQSILNLNDDVNESKEKCSQLEQQINSERSKLYVIAANLSHQTNLNKELEDMLNSKSSEVMELKRILINENRLSSLIAIEKDASSQSENFSSNSVEYMRSADVPRSMDRFSMFIPELSNVSLQKTPEQVEVLQDRIQSKLHFSEDIDEYSEHMNSLENALHDSKSDISSMREELNAVLHDKRLDASYETKLHGLYWVYKRSQGYNKSLVYQKKYLLKLLKGFQMTEKVTLAWLKHMGDGDSPGSHGNDSSTSEILLRGRSLFRSAAFVVIAVQRMKFYVHRWRLLARIPSTQAVNAEVRTVFQTYSVFSPTLTPGDCHLSTISLSSKSTSIDEAAEHLSYSQSSSNSRSQRTPKPKSTSDKRQMTEYLHRLKSLQKQLGIDNFR